MLSIFTVKDIDFPYIGISNGINDFYNFGIRNSTDFRGYCVRSMVFGVRKIGIKSGILFRKIRKMLAPYEIIAENTTSLSPFPLKHASAPLPRVHEQQMLYSTIVPPMN